MFPCCMLVIMFPAACKLCIVNLGILLDNNCLCWLVWSFLLSLLLVNYVPLWLVIMFPAAYKLCTVNLGIFIGQ